MADSGSGGGPPRDKLADRIADAEERLRRSIAQRIERNRMGARALWKSSRIASLASYRSSLATAV